MGKASNLRDNPPYRSLSRPAHATGRNSAGRPSSLQGSYETGHKMATAVTLGGAGERLLPPGPGDGVPRQVDHSRDHEPDLERQVPDGPHVRGHRRDVVRGLVGE